MSMEPVAWVRKSRKNETVKLSDFPMLDSPFNHKNWEEEPLVRLSDAEARVKELEALAMAFEAEANQMREVSIMNRHRAEAAEALLKEAGIAFPKPTGGVE